MTNKVKQKVAVVGAGISGLSAAYLLSQEHDVQLFEAESRLGGHANTAYVGPEKTAVDTGFIVFNELNYPHLTNFFKELDVPVAPSEMTLSVRFDKPNLEWGGTTLWTLIAQRRNLFRPQFWSMVSGILRFHKEAEQNLKLARENKWSLRELLEFKKYSQSFIDWYLVPMGAAIWSTPPETMLDFPAETFLQFCMNHRLLQVEGRPQWKTVRQGSIEYVKRVEAKLKTVHKGTPVESVRRLPNGLELVTSGGKTFHFDAVVFATHPPETLKILGRDLTTHEKEILGQFKYQKNVAKLHSDLRFLPKRRSLWSAWNFHQETSERSTNPISLSYWMNALQPLNTDVNYVVSLNTEREPQPCHLQVAYHHPLFNLEALKAQRRLDAIQGSGGLYFCGAWTRYGFHEDGILSAVQIAKLWNLPIPWEKKPEIEIEMKSANKETQS